MSDATAVVRGWCPGALRPMASGDGLLLRVRPRYARLTTAEALLLADLAETHGNGRMILSHRGTLTLRGFSEESWRAALPRLHAADLASHDARCESARNLLVTPLWEEGDGTTALADALAAMLVARDGAPLPAKFGVVLDTGPAPVLRDVPADIRVERWGDLWCISPEGAETGAVAAASEVAVRVAELIRWFLAMGGMVGGRGRMATLVARRERDLPSAFTAVPLRSSSPRPVPGATPRGVWVGLPFGQIDAEALRVLAREGPLRVSPWRLLLIEGAATAPAVAGLVTRADDPLLAIDACVGSDGCSQGLAATQPLARALAPRWTAPGRSLHVSGCSKGCARPRPADITLVARRDGLFDLVRGGRAGDSPRLGGLSPAALLARPDLLA